jgi:hypothetical protein
LARITGVASGAGVAVALGLAVGVGVGVGRRMIGAGGIGGDVVGEAPFATGSDGGTCADCARVGNRASSATIVRDRRVGPARVCIIMRQHRMAPLRASLRAVCRAV